MIALFIGLFLLFMILVYLYVTHKTNIVSAHVISMEKSKDRYNDFMEKARAANLQVERWVGVDGATLSKEDCFREGVPESEYKEYKSKDKMGKIGCWVAHKNLLRELLKKPVSPTDVHLIFEDDAIIPPDFVARWKALLPQLPHNWDVIQLGVSQPKTLRLYDNVCVPTTSLGNYGTFAYAVRHGALPKIYDHVRIMNGPIDVMYSKKNTIWNWYILLPQLVPHDFGYYSNTENKNYS